MKLLSIIGLWVLPWSMVVTVSREESIFETMEVRRYQIQVNALGDGGAPLRGLAKEDFEVKLNGRLQKVETLEHIMLDVPEMVSRDAGQITQHGRRLFVFFFDFRYTTERGVLAARKAATEFVMKELLPADLMAIFSGSPLRGIVTATNFTNDKNHLLRALSTLGLESAKYVVRGPAGYFNSGLITRAFGGSQVTESQTGLYASSDTINLGENLESIIAESANEKDLNKFELSQEPLEALRENLNEARKAERRNYAGEVMKFVGGFGALAKALTYTRGRKNLVLFSAGYDSSLLTGFNQAQLMENSEKTLTGETWEIDSNQLGDASVMSSAKELVRLLQGSGTVVFAVDTSLLEASGDSKSGIQSLNSMAVDTGGRLFQNQNNLSVPLRQIKNITNEYYILTLVPTGKIKKGALAKLRVKLKGKSGKVFAQKGLLIKPDFATLNPLERQLHLADYMSKDLVSYEVPSELSLIMVPERDNLVRLVVNHEVRGDYFLGRNGSDKSQDIEFYAMAIDEKTDLTFDRISSQYRLNLNQAQEVLSQTGIKYSGNLLVRPGSYKVKVLVRDLNTGRVGCLIKNIEVPQTLPPVTSALISQTPWVSLYGERELQVAGVDLSYPFKLRDRAFTTLDKSNLDGASRAMFFFLIHTGAGETPTEMTGVKALIQDQRGRVSVIPPAALKVDFQKSASGNSEPVLLLLDLARLNLQTGETYKLMTQFALKDHEPIRSITEFTF